jgi:hypothetical protein
VNTVHLQRLAVTIASGALAASAVSLAMAGGAGGQSIDTPTQALETNRPIEAVPATLSLIPSPPTSEPDSEPASVQATPVGDDAATPPTPRIKERTRTDSGKKPEKVDTDEKDERHETVKPRIRDDDDDEEKSEETKVPEEKMGDTRERSSEDGESRSETDTRRTRTEDR